MNGELGKKYLKDYIQRTAPILDDYLAEKSKQAKKIGSIPSKIIQDYSDISSGGKRIRGALIQLAYEIAGEEPDSELLETSLFIELFHTGVLIHDDIMDEDHIRRGVPTIHKRYSKLAKELKVNTDPLHYGEAMAINSGDLGFFFALDKLVNSNFPPDRIILVAQAYSDYVQKVIYGQIMDVTNVSVDEVTEKDILNVLKFKTAVYTGVLPLLSGAYLGGIKDKKILKALQEFGLAFGWCFQIQDDTLGIFGNKAELGKSIGSDIEEGKNTLFTLHLSQNGSKDQVKFLNSILGKEGLKKSDLEKLRNILVEVGSYDYVINLGWKYVEEGKKHISNITENIRMQSILESMIVYMMERTN